MFHSKQAMRELTGGLPWFVAPAQGCIKYHGLYRPKNDEPDNATRRHSLKRKLVSLFQGKEGQVHPTGHLPWQVRRHGTNFHGAGRDLIPEDGTTVTTPTAADAVNSLCDVGLFAFDVERKHNPVFAAVRWKVWFLTIGLITIKRTMTSSRR